VADLADARRLLDQALADGAIGSAWAVEVGDGGQVVWRDAAGHTRRLPTPGEPVGIDCRFDVASLTKIVATTAVAMRQVEGGRFDLDAPVSELLDDLPWADPAAARRITARMLLAHSAGCLWWAPLHERLGDAIDPHRRLIELAAATPLTSPPGKRAVYSDLGFILLGALCERLGGARLDRLARELVWSPLGMHATSFVDLAAPERPTPVAATEICPRRGLLTGEVHDDNAHAAGGVAGHAGAFSTVGDLGRFAQATLASWAGTPVPGGFRHDVARAFATRTGPAGSTRALGWDTPSPGAGASQAGDLWPREHAVGHGGFTGTSMWLDLERARWVVLLTNRVHPDRADERIKLLRPRLHDAIVTALGS
jgi:CubicO group peptidase (beta-lactamase class C family)